MSGKATGPSETRRISLWSRILRRAPGNSSLNEAGPLNGRATHFRIPPARVVYPSGPKIPDMLDTTRMRLDGHISFQKTECGHVKYVTMHSIEIFDELISYSHSKGIKLVIVIIGASQTDVSYYTEKHKDKGTFIITLLGNEAEVESLWMEFKETHRDQHDRSIFVIGKHKRSAGPRMVPV